MIKNKDRELLDKSVEVLEEGTRADQSRFLSKNWVPGRSYDASVLYNLSLIALKVEDFASADAIAQDFAALEEYGAAGDISHSLRMAGYRSTSLDSTLDNLKQIGHIASKLNALSYRFQHLGVVGDIILFLVRIATAPRAILIAIKNPDDPRLRAPPHQNPNR